MFVLANLLRTTFLRAPEGVQGGGAPASPAPSQRGHAFDDIAASLIQPREEADPKSGQDGANQTRRKADTGEGEGETPDSKPEPSPSSEQTTEDDTDAEAGADNQGADEGENPDDDFFDPFNDEAADTDDAEPAENEEDDPVFTVTVDGEQRQVTLSELKRRYSGEGAIEARLQQATEAKKQAEALKAQAEQELRQAQQQVSADRNKLANAIKALQQTLLQPNVKMPDPTLRTKNPQEYLLKMEEYRADQARLQQRARIFQEALEGNEQMNQQELADLRNAEAAKLVEKVPAFKDPQRGPQLQKTILDAAQAVGFSPQDVASVYDHRLFQLALKAGLYDQMMAKRKQGKPEPKRKTVIAPGSATQSNGQGNRLRSQQRQAYQKARETGKPEDVAATLIVPSKRR